MALYRAYRARFVTIPLHMDTGFYVTNRTVVRRRYEPFRGWNAVFAGGSRLLPEFAHSRIFLRAGAGGYARGFREYYTWLAVAASTATGVTARLLLSDETAFWVAAIVAAALLAESQYGAYFESAEWFEVAMQSCGVACATSGLVSESSAGICAGITLLWLDFVAVKLTGLLPALLTTIAVVWFHPALLAPCSAIAVSAVVVQLYLSQRSGVRPTQLLAYLRRHEAHIRRRYRNPAMLIAVKLAFAARLLAGNPGIPILAIIGVARARGTFFVEPAFVAYAAFVFGLVLAFLLQGNRVWYYLLVLLPSVAIFASAGFLWLAREYGSKIALLAVVLAVAFSVGRNLWQLRGSDLAIANRRIWSVYNRPGGRFGDEFSQANLAVASACSALRARLRGSSLLVLGRQNQAYALLEASYDTPIVSVCELAANVAGDLRSWIPAGPDAEKPEYLLDTEHAIDAARSYLPWLGEYALAEQHGSVRLFRRQAAGAESGGAVGAVGEA